MQKIFPFLGFLLTLNVASAQNFKPSPPLDIPLVLSGTFAELRGNHFHGGIDIKTQGRSGLKVQAIADGYVSRVAVSPYGYGNAIYVRHPEGYTSVYGHLNAFYPELERWVEQQLRDRSKNDGNLYPGASDFKVVRGQFIAFSGNTGGSFGPHLHFEIRDTKTEEPLNPLDFGIEVLDSKKPGLHAIGWVNEALTRSGTAKFKDTIYAYEPVGLDLWTTDKQDLASNSNGVYGITCRIGQEELFTAEYTRINFSRTRYINAHINFSRWWKSGRRYTRLYEVENNPLKLTQTTNHMMPSWRSKKGFIAVSEGATVRVDIHVEDKSGNHSDAYVYITGVKGSPAPKPSHQWDQQTVLKEGPLTVTIPAGALYHDAEFTLTDLGAGRYKAGAGLALQKHMLLSWELDFDQQRGAGWFLWEADRKGKKSAIPGKREDNVMKFRTRSTGTYALDQDLRKPEVRLLKTTSYPRSNSQFRELRVSAADDKTGVERYSARIDGEFARIDFDYKKELLKVIVPKELATGKHNLRIVVIDGVGNTTVKEYPIVL